MKKFSLHIILASCVLSLLAAAPSLQAQKPLKQIPKTNEVFRPQILTGRSLTPAEALALVASHGQKVSSDAPFEKRPWDVYSDRDDNKTYSTPKIKDEYSSLKMGEKVRIARFKGDFALVYTVRPGEENIYPQIPGQADWKGWIPVSNLLLWDQPLLNANGRLIRVVLSSRISERSPSNSIGKLYQNPSAAGFPRNLPTDDCTSSFYYLLKNDGAMRLLCKDKTGGTDMENLYGWVEYSSIQTWETGLALEPTWDPELVASFESVNYSSSITPYPAPGEKIGSIEFVSREMPQYKTDFYRPEDHRWRILYNAATPDEQYYDVLMAADSPYLDAGKKPVTTQSSSWADDLNTVNIYFVLEGSRDCESNFPLVVESMREFPNLLPGRTVNVGAMIYRDLWNEDYSTEFHVAEPVRTRGLQDFIDQGGEYGFQDNATSPAMFKAIRELVERSRLRPSENNVFIVIGARGDASNIMIDEIADLLDGNNVLLYGIQSHNHPVNPSFQLFAYQLEALIHQKLAIRREKVSTGVDVILRKTRQRRSARLTEFALNSPEKTYLEEVIYNPEDGELDEVEYKAQLRDICEKISRHIDQQISERAGQGLSSQLFTRAYVNMADNSGHPFFDFVACFDEDDFARLMESFKRIHDISSGSNDKFNMLYNALTVMQSAVHTDLGLKPDEQGIYEIFRAFEGLPLLANEYPGVPVKSIRDRRITPVELGRILADFNLKYEKLLEIRNGSYPYTTTINGRTHYWIPLQYLP